MNDQARRLERVQHAGHRLISADRERAAALQEATLALQALDEVPVDELAGHSGLSHPAVHALLSRTPGVSGTGRRDSD